MDEKVEQYLKRIGYLNKTLNSDLKTLEDLILHHVTSIPFENLNPILNLPVKIDIESVYEKIVSNLRGGYCYEQNTLFYYVLKNIGFDVKALAGRVIWNQPKDSITTLTHMFLLITIANEEYLVDLGFGAQTPTAPIKFLLFDEQQTPHELYRINKLDHDFVLETFENDIWKSMYQFNKTPQQFIDFEVGNWYTSTHPDFIFTNLLFVAIADQSTRFTLINNKFKKNHLNGSVENKTLLSIDDFKEILTNVFKINLNNLNELDQKLNEILQND